MQKPVDDDELRVLFGNAPQRDRAVSGLSPLARHEAHNTVAEGMRTPARYRGPFMASARAIPYNIPSSTSQSHPRFPPRNISPTAAYFPFADTSWYDPAAQTFIPEIWDDLPPPDGFSISQSSSALVTSPTSPLNISEQGENGQKKRSRISHSARRLLQASFQHHIEDPYVPAGEVNELSAQTGLSAKQIRTFFANARARKLPRANRNTKVPGFLRQQNPMERFLSSSPEDEGISEVAVREAARTLSSPHYSQQPTRNFSSRTNAMSVSEAAVSSTSGSNSSRASIDSANNRGARRGRKRQREPTQKTFDAVIRKPSDPSKIFQCTFCTLDFVQKYDWKRHEESVHLPQKEWVCMPRGSAYASTEGPRCVFCDEQNPDEAHLEEHKYTVCIDAPRGQRAFSRKDKLTQHLQQVHRCRQPPKNLNDWCRPIERAISILCGICGMILPDWPTRLDHVAAHFASGVHMDKWMLPRPGGIIPHISTSGDWLELGFSIVPKSDGCYPCTACPDRFETNEQIILHERQIHCMYLDWHRKRLHSSWMLEYLEMQPLALAEQHPGPVAKPTFYKGTGQLNRANPSEHLEMQSLALAEQHPGPVAKPNFYKGASQSNRANPSKHLNAGIGSVPPGSTEGNAPYTHHAHMPMFRRVPTLNDTRTTYENPAYNSMQSLPTMDSFSLEPIYTPQNQRPSSQAASEYYNAMPQPSLYNNGSQNNGI